VRGPDAFPPLDVDRFMREALAEAEKAGRAGELPIGSVVVLDEAVIGLGRSRRQEQRTQLAHAELAALLDGREQLADGHERAVLFSTVEPCPLCLGAVVMADVPHVVFAAYDVEAGVPELLAASPYVRRHIQTYRGGVLASESLALARRFRPELLPYLRLTSERDPVPASG
jgi:tRNA(adenine34) deaminase